MSTHKKTTIVGKKQAAAILGLAISTFGTGSAVSAGLGEIARAFPGAGELAIQMLVSLPAVALVPASLYAGVVAARLGKRRMAIAGSAIYLLGGVGAGLVNTIGWMLFMRLVIGLGAGILLPLPLSLIADFYEGHARARLTGMLTAVASLGGMSMTVGAGLLAGVHWRLVFCVYLVMLPVLLMSVFWLRAPEQDAAPINFCLHREALVVGFYLFSITVVLFSLPLYMALHVARSGLGGSFEASLVLIMPNFAGLFMGGVFARLRSVFGRETGPLGLAFLAAGFFLLARGGSVPVLVLGALGFGVGIGIINPVNYLRLVNGVPREDAPFSVAIVNAMMSLGQFAAPLWYALLGALGAVGPIDSVYRFNAWLVSGLCLFFFLRRLSPRSGEPPVCRPLFRR